MLTASKILQKWYKPLHKSEIAELCIEEAMKEYAAQFIELAAEEVNNFETLVDTYDCIKHRNKDVSNSILKLKEQIK